MTEQEAQDWLRHTFSLTAETQSRLELFVALLSDEMQRQNLISRGSFDHIWTRHIVDSAQLLIHAPRPTGGTWLDLGTGAGFPGMIIALLSDFHVLMVESRRKRINFLESVVEKLELTEKALVLGDRLENIEGRKVDVISGRAFAPLDKLLKLSHRFSTEKTHWILPKGKNAIRELKELPPKRQKMFHVEQSITDKDAWILIGKG